MKTFEIGDYQEMVLNAIRDDSRGNPFTPGDLTNAFIHVLGGAEAEGWITTAQADYLVNRTAMEVAIVSSVHRALSMHASPEMLNQGIEAGIARIAEYNGQTEGGTLQIVSVFSDDAEPDGVYAVNLDNPEELHRSIAEAVGESGSEQQVEDNKVGGRLEMGG